MKTLALVAALSLAGCVTPQMQEAQMRQQAAGMSYPALCYFAMHGNGPQQSIAVSEIARRGTAHCSEDLARMGFQEVQQGRAIAASRQQMQDQQTMELARQLMQPPPAPPTINCTSRYNGVSTETTCR